MMSQTRARKAWISAAPRGLAAGLVLAMAMPGLTGCATSEKQLLPTQPGVTMSSIWHSATAPGAGGSGLHQGESRTSRLSEARAALRRPITPAPSAAALRAGYTRNAAKAVEIQFPRLPNPDMALYVFPHLTGGSGEQVPIPGYTTVFPMYEHPHYAQPGERALATRSAPGTTP